MLSKVETQVETPSGKGASDENFPVGSWILARSLRPHVKNFYAFARAIDDIADNSDLSPEEKISRLESFRLAVEDGIGDPEVFLKAHRLRHTCEQVHIPVCHALDLITAFKQDAVKGRYESWDELINYCLYSAAPVGRFLLDLHGENQDRYPESDALCNALQILNHLQDCQSDHRLLDRVYLPLDWMKQCGAHSDDLQKERACANLRKVIDLCLDGVEELLFIADSLPERVLSRRLRIEAQVVVFLARRLCVLLRRGDPIAGRVGLSKRDFFWYAIKGMIQGSLGKRQSS